MKTSSLSMLSLACLCLAGSKPVSAVDWPQWLGPNANNLTSASAGFNPDLAQWKRAWKAEIGKGYSSVIVAGGQAFTMGHDGQTRETVTCMDAATGEIRWQHSYEAKLIDSMHVGGPNASPTVAGDRVYTLSKDGQALCLSRDKGETIWKADLMEIMGLEKLPRWGFASSPVLYDDKVLYSSGRVVALNAKSGEVVWKSAEPHYEGYTTPVVFSYEGQDYIASLDGKGLSVLTAKEGKELDRHPFKAQYDMVATTPAILENGSRLFISGNTSSEMVGFDGRELSSLWTTRELRNTMNNSVIIDGVLYGIDGKQKSSRSRLVSLNAADGKVNWVKEDFGYGNTIGVGQTLLALTEDGELVTATAKRDGYEELARREVLSEVCWTTPVYANGRIYVRNDHGQVVCLNAP